MGGNSKDRRDYYYYQAKVLGYRARSAFKLLDIDREFNIFEASANIIDLCAAPGSWSQVLRQQTSAKIVAIDVQEMVPIEGVHILKQDITSEECFKQVESIFGSDLADLIVCDGAPDVTGFHDLDEFLQSDLLKASLALCQRLGKIGSTFVGKCFRGEYSGYIVRHFKKFYTSVELVKPKASRNVSVECFIVCRGMVKTDVDPSIIEMCGEPINFEVRACGNGPDPDFINCDAMNAFSPSAPPISPPYLASINARRK